MSQGTGDVAFDRATSQLAGLRETALDARGLSVVFASVLLYVCIIIGASTHEQMLRVSGVNLPVLSVEIPIVGFYLLTPLLILFLHLNLLIQHYLLSQQLFTLSRTLHTVTPEQRNDLLRSLGHLPFVHWLLGEHHPLRLRALFSLVIHTAYVVWPLLTMLALQIAFLPYHDEVWTLLQQLMVIADCVLLVSLWPKVLDPEDSASNWWKPLRRKLAAVFRLGFKRPAGAEPAATAPASPRPVLTALLLASLVTAVLLWSVTIATVTDGRLERAFVAITPAFLLAHCGEPNRRGLPPTCWAHEGERAWWPRNLVVRDKVVTANKLDPNIENAVLSEWNPARVDLSKAIGVNLRDRDLRYADLTGISLPKADLRGADLTGAQLERARLVGADLRPSVDRVECARIAPDSPRVPQPGELRRTIAVGANFSHSSFVGARLDCANLSGATFKEASLHGAVLDGAQLHGSVLDSAKLDAAIMRNAVLQAATLVEARLNGVNAQNASFVAVNAVSAQLTGADLYGALFAGAALGGVDIIAADFRNADLRDIQDPARIRRALENFEKLVPAGALRRSDRKDIRVWVRNRVEKSATVEPQLGSLQKQQCIGRPNGSERYGACMYSEPAEAVAVIKQLVCKNGWMGQSLLHRLYIAQNPWWSDRLLSKFDPIKETCPLLRQEVRKFGEVHGLQFDIPDLPTPGKK